MALKPFREITILEAVAGALVMVMQAELAAIGLRDSEIINNVTYEVDDKKGTIAIYLPYYWKFIEKGRRPGAKRPPIVALIVWMRRKRIAPGKEQRVAWAIATAIARRGIRARPFINKAAADMEQQASVMLDVRFDLAFEDAIVAILNS